MRRLYSTWLVCLLQMIVAAAFAHELRVEVTPAGAGSLNNSGGTYDEGSNVYLRTYQNTGYVFRGWYEDGTLLSMETGFNYNMPAHDAVVQARYEYDPTVPADPSMPDTTTYYALTTSVSPHGAGTLNNADGRYAAGRSVTLRTYNNTGYVFQKWQDDAGETVSTSAGFSFVMPRHDTHLTAIYTYDPTVPADPDSMAVKYTATVRCKPDGGGSFNTNSFTVEEGASTRLYAYTNTGFRFVQWEDEQGNVISEEQNFYFVMPHGNCVVYGVFDFDPAPPSNPWKNYWNKELGEVIVDDFTPGRLEEAVADAIKGSSRSDVAMITVAGRMNDNDFGVANNYSQCTLLDLSRVTGVTEVPSYAFDYTSLETVALPATIEAIGYRAFAECRQLSSLTIYAMTPPTLGQDAFAGVPEGLVIYVPAAAIAQYQETETWQGFTILPIQDDVRSITVSLPEGARPADFAQMWLELTNTKNGQRMHYVMTDRTSYTFANIIRNTAWNVVLRNQRGDVFGRIDNVEVADDDVSVSFSRLSVPQSVRLSVLTPDGADVTSLVQVTWTDTSSNYIGQGATLSGMCAGTTVVYSLSLPKDLAMLYVRPSQTEHAITEQANLPVCHLAAIGEMTLTGKVVDALTGAAIASATVSASQTFDGRHDKTVATRTDNYGAFELKVSRVPTTLAVSSSDYVSYVVNCDTLTAAADAVASVGVVALKPISGAVIDISFTYTKCSADGEQAETQNWYGDWNNTSYQLYNKTRRQAIGQFSVQYPQIVLLEEVSDGDEIELTASSNRQAFMPVTTTTVIGDGRGEAVFGIVEYGKIQARFEKTRNAAVTGSLYDAGGRLLKTCDYAGTTLTIADLPDGSYTLVSMGSSNMFNTIYDLSQLPETGLTPGTDYVQSAVEVRSGAIATLLIPEVPALDESKLYYTGSSTSFTVNKPSIVAGNYLTLTARIDFKPAYVGSVSGVRLVVDLPESCTFVDNSVMVGNTTATYTVNQGRVTIPLAQHTDRMRFCVIPTLGGNYAPSAFAQFDIDGKTVTQPIGSAAYTATDLSISVPKTVAKTTVPISGTAIGKSQIDIYDNDVLIGQTTSLANGTWATTCQLDEPTNLSRHSIHARVTTAQGIELQTETMQCLYDMNAVQVSVVRMYHDNPEMRKTFELTFDFQNPSDKEENYIYYIYNKVFTFTIDFTDNNPERVSDVVLYVKTAKSGWHPLKATYDEKQDLWVASGEFGNMYDGDLPVNVSVDFTFDSVVAADFSKVRKIFTDESLFEETKAEYRKIDAAVQRLVADPTDNEPFIAAIDDLLTPDDLAEIKAFEDSIAVLTDDEIDRLMDAALQRETTEDFTPFATQTVYDRHVKFEAGGYTLELNTCDHLTKADVKEGFMAVNTVEGDTVYVLNSKNRLCYVDFAYDIYYDVTYAPTADATRFRDKSQEEMAWDYYSFLADEKLFNKMAEDETAAANKFLKQYRKDAGILKRCKRPEKIAEYSDKVVRGQLNYNGALRTAGQMSRMAKAAKYGVPAVDFALNGIQFYDKYQEVGTIIDEPTGCTSAEHLAAEDAYRHRARDMRAEAFFYHSANFAGGTLAGIGIAALGVLWPPSLLITVPAAFAANYAVDTWYDNRFTNNSNKLYVDYSNLRKECADDPDPNDDGGQHKSGNPDKKYGIDPSGFVYEGVFSNRVEGVTATVFYKEQVEDMYGDLHDNIVMWDAAEYAQENPLFTDENGYYRWDVPTGLWQVKFEKEGYETTFSEWLPVPPPQLDINIAMTQNIQPTVKAARAYEDAVEIEFDKYMMPDGLTTQNIIVQQDGHNVEGTVRLLNEEPSYEGRTDTYASKVRFDASAPFEAEQVTLLVTNRVSSYAGIRMQDDYQQTFDITPEVKLIDCDSIATVVFGHEATLTVTVLPARASKGKTLRVKTSSPMILGVGDDHPTIADDGTAQVTVAGRLPGTAQLTFAIDDADVSAATQVSIEQEAMRTAERPRASIVTGSLVDRGTAIALTCATEGATIYYTLDGSCPCENTEGRKAYDGTPIVINKTTTIRAMAVAPGMYESDVAEFTYIVSEEDAIGDVVADSHDVRIYPLPMRDRLNVTADGAVIRSVRLMSVNGVSVASADHASSHVVLDVSKIPTGVYVVHVVTEGKSLSRKVRK